jgi:molecular chaperone GrpE
MNDKPDELAGGPAQGDSAAQADAGLGKAPGEQGTEQILAGLKAENADLRDKLLRAIAEMENFRRRAEREKSDVMKYAVSEFARDVVSIGDNLRRAIEAVQKEAVENDPALKTLLEGVEVTERELIKVFERHGVKRFDPLGEKFDPHVHEAMVKVDVPNVPAETVDQVLQAGYKINDRVLRPAAVIVAKGGSAVAQPQAERPPAEQSFETIDGEGFEPGPEGARAKPGFDREPEAAPEATGAPKSPPGQGARKPAGEKRTSTVTKPVTENSAPLKKDDLISSFGKRLENGN